MDLHLDQRELATCVQCGLCLPHCPTFRVSGDESRSPRGRIALMRAVQSGGAPLTDEVVRSFETCVMCRGCEAACPSQVPFGHLMERTRETLVGEHGTAPALLHVALSQLGHPRRLRAGARALALAQRLRLLPARLSLPALPLREEPHRSSGQDVFLFTGCVMDAWQRDVHRAGQRLLEVAGFGVHPTGDAAPCCGALHAHTGFGNDARRLAQRAIDALGGDQPILVDSAGCGAAMKEYGRLLDTEEARAFSARVFDYQEWLAPRLDALPPVTALEMRVAVQDPCHLRHVQRVHLATRDFLRPFVRELVELDDDGLCCGAGGAYSLLEPEMAAAVRERKLAAIARAAPDVVASANPGCSLHLAAAGVRVLHPVTIAWAALSGRAPANAPADEGVR